MIGKKITDTEIVKGFKVAIKHKNKYFSSISGVEYKKGWVEPYQGNGRKQFPYQCSMWAFKEILVRGGKVFDWNLVGKTCIFLKKEQAKTYLEKIHVNEGTPVILKMKLSKDLHHGRFNGPNYIGSYIEDFKEIKNES